MNVDEILRNLNTNNEHLKKGNDNIRNGKES